MKILNYNLFLENKINIDKLNRINSIINSLPYVYNVNDKQIYRGIGHDIGTHIQKKRDTTREMRGWLPFVNKLDSWIKFGADREKSIICTTNKTIAKNWGHRGNREYVIIPLKDEIYISSGDDFNLDDSWRFVNLEFDKYYNITDKSKSNNMKSTTIRYSLNEICKYLGINDLLKSNSYNKIFNIIDNNLSKIDNDKNTYFTKNTNILIKRILTFGDIESYFNYIYDPHKNGFKKMKYSDFIKELNNTNNYENNEVWFNSDCLIIEHLDFIDFKYAINNNENINDI